MIWKDVPGYEGLYKVSDEGEVYSYKPNYNRILKPYPNKKGYLTLDLRKNNKRKSYRVHRLVALAFLPNFYNKPTVDHINRCKTDNRLYNLRWATQSEQCYNHGLRITNKLKEKYIHFLEKINRFRVQIRLYNIQRSFKTLQEAIIFRDNFLSDHVDTLGTK